jgi:hypothetical protein
MPASNKPKMILNFAGVIDKSNANFDSIDGTGRACMTGVVVIGEVPLELGQFVSVFKVTIIGNQSVININIHEVLFNSGKCLIIKKLLI